MVDEIVLSADQLNCLASPACNLIVQSLRTLGQGSAVDLAKVSGKSPATVHYHLKTLVRVGLVTEVASRPTSRKPEAVFELAADRFTLPSPEIEPEVSELTLRAIEAGTRQMMRGYANSVRHSSNYHLVIRSHTRLSPEDAERFIDMVEVASRFAIDNQVTDGIAIHWSSILYSDPE